MGGIKMKVKNFILLAVSLMVFVVCFAFGASAEEFTEGYYTYTVENGEATIVAVDASISGDVVIPDTLGGYDVTNIGDFAFNECHSLTGLYIHEKIEYIGEDAFHNCNKLLTIATDENSENFSTVDGVLFNKDKSVLIKYPAAIENTSYIIPETVAEIGNNAFTSCKFNKIIIPDSVYRIGVNAFWGCGNLEEIIISDSVKQIGEYAFYSCERLAKIELSECLSEISASTFAHCYALTDITLPDNIEIIGAHAFERCYSLINVITCSKTIGDKAFEYCENLKNITINNIEKVGGNAFYGCQSIENVYLLSLEKWCAIDFENDYANPISFSTTAKLYINNVYAEDIVIPETVTDIGNYAFCYNESIKSVTLPKSIKRIGDFSFYSCDSLTDVFYKGSPASWSLIDFGEANQITSGTTLHFSETGNTFTLSDTDTGIEAEYRYDDFEGYERQQELVIIKGGPNANLVFKDAYGRYMSYDISFKVNGYEIQPDFDVTIKIPIPEGYNRYTTAVYYIDEDGAETKLNSTYSNGYIIFLTDHFSEYALVDESSKIEEPSAEPDEPVTEPDTPDEPTTEPDTSDDPSDKCSCRCHKGGIAGFIYRILRFFWKLFKINPVCTCGVTHY